MPRSARSTPALRRFGDKTGSCTLRAELGAVRNAADRAHLFRSLRRERPRACFFPRPMFGESMAQCLALSLFGTTHTSTLSLSYLVCVVFVAREHAGGEERGGGCSCEPGEGERGRRFGGGPCRRRRQQSRRRHRRGGPRAGQRGSPRQEHAGHGELAESA